MSFTEPIPHSTRSSQDQIVSIRLSLYIKFFHETFFARYNLYQTCSSPGTFFTRPFFKDAWQGIFSAKQSSHEAILQKTSSLKGSFFEKLRRSLQGLVPCTPPRWLEVHDGICVLSLLLIRGAPLALKPENKLLKSSSQTADTTPSAQWNEGRLAPDPSARWTGKQGWH